jgi:hypothetical protein
MRLLKRGRRPGLFFCEEEFAGPIEFGDDVVKRLRGLIRYPHQAFLAGFGSKRQRQHCFGVGVLRRNNHFPRACDHAGQLQD